MASGRPGRAAPRRAVSPAPHGVRRRRLENCQRSRKRRPHHTSPSSNTTYEEYTGRNTSSRTPPSRRKVVSMIREIKVDGEDALEVDTAEELGSALMSGLWVRAPQKAHEEYGLPTGEKNTDAPEDVHGAFVSGGFEGEPALGRLLNGLGPQQEVRRAEVEPGTSTTRSLPARSASRSRRGLRRGRNRGSPARRNSGERRQREGRTEAGNSLYLSVAQTAKGYSDNRWGTYKQIKELGGQVRKGEKGSHVLFYKFDDEQRAREDGPRDESGKPGEPGEQSRPPLVRAYTVFNVEQAEGLKLERREDAEPAPEWKAHQAAELVIRESGVSVHHVRGDRAFYNHNRDTVTLPERDQFATAKQLLPDRDARTRPRHRPRKPDGPRDVDERRRDRLQPRGSEEQLHGDGDGVGRQRRLRHRRRDDQRHGRGRAAAQAGQADAGAGLGLVDGADRDLDGAGAQRRPGDRRLQPAVPGGHVGLVERPPLDAGVIPTREIINLTPGHVLPGAGAGGEQGDPQRLVGPFGRGAHLRAGGDDHVGGGDLDAAGERHLRGGRGDPLHGDLQRGGDVTGNPVFWFWIESNVLPVEAEYESGSGSTSLVFTYTVLSTDEDDDGIYLGGSNDFDQPAGPVRLLIRAMRSRASEVRPPPTSSIMRSAVGRRRTTRWTAA